MTSKKAHLWPASAGLAYSGGFQPRSYTLDHYLLTYSTIGMNFDDTERAVPLSFHNDINHGILAV